MIYLIAAMMFALGLVLAAITVACVAVVWLSSPAMETRYRNRWNTLKGKQ